MLAEITMERDAALLKILAMREKETVMDLVTEVYTMVMLDAKEILSVGPTIVESLVSTITRRMTVVSVLVLVVVVDTLATSLVRPTGPSGAASVCAVSGVGTVRRPGPGGVLVPSVGSVYTNRRHRRGSVLATTVVQVVEVGGPLEGAPQLVVDGTLNLILENKVSRKYPIITSYYSKCSAKITRCYESNNSMSQMLNYTKFYVLSIKKWPLSLTLTIRSGSVWRFIFHIRFSNILLSILSECKWYGGHQEQDRAEDEEARPYQGQGQSVVIQVGLEWSYHHWKIASHLVHTEQEESDAGGSHIWLNNLNNDSEEDGKPSLCKQVVDYQGGHGGWRLEIQGQDSKWSCHQSTS